MTLNSQGYEDHKPTYIIQINFKSKVSQYKYEKFWYENQQKNR